MQNLIGNVSAVGLKDAIEHLVGRIEHAGLAFGDGRISKAGAIVPSSQFARSDAVGEEGFLREEVGIRIPPDQPTPFPKRQPEQHGERHCSQRDVKQAANLGGFRSRIFMHNAGRCEGTDFVGGDIPALTN